MSSTSIVKDLKEKTSRRRVLIVEDNEIQAGLLSSRLKKAGIEPYVAINGVRGLEEVGKIQPEMIVMDVNMPLMDGITLTKHLKESQDTRSIPIVAVSADDSREKCMAAGCDAFFLKPYSKELFEQINLILDRKKQAS